ncbi:MAG: T9SS type A sorting domain-containing protein [Saprospiraceae bacterium]|nr:T9SS type A sorting domain-containing protein [Saprospiraceae bacterium]
MQKMYISMLFILAVFTTFSGYSQINQCSPNCNDLNASILTDQNGLEYHAKINWTDIISNFNCSLPVSYTLYSNSGSQIARGSSADVGSTDYFLIEDVCRYLNDGVKVYISNGQGTCWSNITFKKNVPTIIGRRVTVYCDHPIIDSPAVYINSLPPVAFVPCQGRRTPTFAADWIFPQDCDPGVQDTVMQILREWEFFDKDGKRASAFDTSDVLLFPQITDDHIYCAEKDTVYCGEPSQGVGPFITYDSLNSGICDTIYLVKITDTNRDGVLEFHPREFDDKCGLAVHLDYDKFGSDCENIYRVDLHVKQSCYGVPQSNCVIMPPAGTAPNMAVEVAPGYWRCTFWITDLDTLPPVSECKFDKISPEHIFWSAITDSQGTQFPQNTHCFVSTQGAPIVIVPTSTHECAGYTYLPPLCVYDDWSGVKQVKASIAGFGAWIFSPNGDTCDFLVYGSTKVKGYCYKSHTQVKLPKSEEPYQLLYEVYDNCHNLDSHYCYLYVKDQTKPVPVLNKGITVSLGEKKVWVEAKAFDEGSWDNCGVNLFLARRKDWTEACINLCDSVKVCCTTEHHDTLRMAFLQPDKHQDEIEAHYAKTLDWLRNDGVPCGNLLYNSGQYALMKYATLECAEHPYSVDDAYFRSRFLQCYEDYLYGNVNGSIKYDIDPSLEVEYCFDRWGFVDPYLNPGCDPHFVTPGDDGLAGLNTYEQLLSSEIDLINTYEAIGGGWAEDVVFSCEDACGSVTVEILVMDYWCNWAKGWVDVRVEDRVPAEVVKDVSDYESITCKTYKDKRYPYLDEGHPVSIEYIVDQAKTGSSDAYDALNVIFGSYEKAWTDPYGNYVDIEGMEIDCDIPFYDSICRCTSKIVQYRVYDDHLGYIWKDSLISNCYYEADTTIFRKGIVSVNCSQNVYCEQTVWCDIDHCGEGYIYRKFKIWQGCPDSTYSQYSLGDEERHPVDTIFRQQRIFVGNECELNKYMFDVPGDLNVYSCGVQYDPSGSGQVVGAAGPENTGYARYKFDDDCRLIGIAHQDKVFKVVGGEEACYKVIRTWFFADWCGTGGEPVSSTWWRDKSLVIDSCIQKILLIDTTAPICAIETPPVVDGGTIEFGACDYDLSVKVTSTDACGLTSCYWELKEVSSSVHLVVDSGEGVLKGADSTSFLVESEGLLSGTYKLKVKVVDECNNESYCEYNFTLVSVKKPSPVCVTSLTADIIPWDTNQDGIADSAHAVVWAYEFDQSSQAPCGGSDDSLHFYIEFKGNNSDSFDLSRVADNLVVTCNDIGTRMVRMWVVDNFGASDYCDVFLVVQNNANACEINQGEAGLIYGTIEDEQSRIVSLVEVKAESEQIVANINTGADGNFRFEAPMGSQVRLIPSKNINPKNGITTADLILMLNQVSGASPSTSPYRRLASDINRDRSINAVDMLELRQLILGDIDRFSVSDSWRFVDKDFQFLTEKPESEVVKDWIDFNLDQPTMQGGFIGIKVGDLDMDNDPKFASPRSGEKLVFTTSDFLIQAGKTYRIPISATEFQAVAGYQYTLEVDHSAAEIIDFELGELKYLDETNFGVHHLSEGLLTTSWNATSQGISADWGQILYSLIIQAKQDGRLSDILKIGGKITSPESYKDAKVAGVALEFDALNLGENIILFQNAPNPATEYTNIDFYLPTNTHIQLIINDVSGKVIRKIEGHYASGKHSIAFNTQDLPLAQVYFYTLIAGDKVITKKMVFVH